MAAITSTEITIQSINYNYNKNNLAMEIVAMAAMVITGSTTSMQSLLHRSSVSSEQRRCHLTNTHQYVGIVLTLLISPVRRDTYCIGFHEGCWMEFVRS